jgi:hypothetical protein
LSAKTHLRARRKGVASTAPPPPHAVPTLYAPPDHGAGVILQKGINMRNAANRAIGGDGHGLALNQHLFDPD